MNSLNVFIAGKWDATNLWLQWDDLQNEAGYKVQVRYREPGKDWGPWIPIEETHALHQTWMVIPTWHQGWAAQARVAVMNTDDWCDAREVTFLRSKCLFEFATTKRTLHYQAGGEFSTIVDGAACTYRLNEEIEVEPGQSFQVEMTAGRTTGYCQLDYPGHFEMRPNLGVVIRNVEPSVDDVMETGRDFTVMEAGPFEPIKVVFGQSVMSGARPAPIA